MVDLLIGSPIYVLRPPLVETSVRSLTDIGQLGCFQVIDLEIDWKSRSRDHGNDLGDSARIAALIW